MGTRSEGSQQLCDDSVKNAKAPLQGRQMAMAARFRTEILCSKKYEHMGKRTEPPVLREGNDFIQNEKQLHYHENQLVEYNACLLNIM